MSIYDKISKMLGRESEAEKLYKVLNTDEYKERPYEYSDLGEGMAVIGETMLGWWKHRFLINHNTKCAYEFMNKDQKLVTVTEDDIDWESLKNLPEDAVGRAQGHSLFISLHSYVILRMEWLKSAGRSIPMAAITWTRTVMG